MRLGTADEIQASADRRQVRFVGDFRLHALLALGVGSAQTRNCGFPSSPRHTISPSSTADRVSTSAAMAAFRTENDLNSFPLREISLDTPYSIRTSERKPSHLTSKSQSGCENGSRARPSGIVWKCGRGTQLSIPNLARSPRICARLLARDARIVLR
jgi:hypothetical protein